MPLLRFLILLVMLAAPGFALAEDASKVGFVDIEVVLDSSRAIRSLVAEVDEGLAREAAEIERAGRELEQLRQSLRRQGGVLSDSERRERQQRATELIRSIEEMEFRFNRRMREEQRQTIEPLLREVMVVIAEVGRREEYDLVVRGEVVLYGASTVDLTPLVVEELDEDPERLREALRGNESEGPSPQAEEGEELLPMLPE